MFEFLNKPIIKNTTVTYKKIAMALIPTIIFALFLDTERFRGQSFVVVVIAILTVVAAAIIFALMQLLFYRFMRNKLKK